MATNVHGTAIQWTHQPGYKGETWNPIIAIHKETGKRGWHCEHCSRGCDNCYAEAQNKAGIRMGTREAYTRVARERVSIELHEKTLLKTLSWKQPRCIFVCSMTDLFGEWVSDGWLNQIFAVMALCPQHRWMVLTKRSRRMREYLTTAFRVGDDIPNAIAAINAKRMDESEYWSADHEVPGWPLPNVWLGVTTENQDAANQRIPALLASPAAFRWVSYEPAIGTVDFKRIDSLPFHKEVYGPAIEANPDINASDFWPASQITNCLEGYTTATWNDDFSEGLAVGGMSIAWPEQVTPNEKINLIVVGGESGRGARPFDINWARQTVRDCGLVGTACFVKQLGKTPVDSHTGQTLKGLGSHGAAFDLWPDDLKVRQFPEVRS